MKKFLAFLSLLPLGVLAVDITTTNVPSVGNLDTLRRKLNDTLLVISNNFAECEFIKTASAVTITNNYPLTAGDYYYVVTAASGASITNLRLPTPTRAGQVIDVINLYTGEVTLSRVAGNASALYPSNVTNVTLQASGGAAQFIAPSTTNWVLRGMNPNP